ncbi:MAG TPA: PaaX family transcriptional regulator C-terminal domain-containing protein [Streptosporangiaceae bacterium]|nr:PaaX family transcriptional regulator C-terminal domain-containing protein [Streptosporangiaceae bacterium]
MTATDVTGASQGIPGASQGVIGASQGIPGASQDAMDVSLGIPGASQDVMDVSLGVTGAGAGRATPVMSRRHAAGGESARGLLFTVLGEFVLPSGGSAWTSAFIDVMAGLGVEQKACRQALMRTAAGGWLTAERSGRRTRWSLTPSAERLLTEGTERIYGFGRAGQPWDGRWLLILARAAAQRERQEADRLQVGRPARHRLRTRLSWAGFGSPAPGVWVSTHADRIDEAQRVLDEAGLLGESQIFQARWAGGGPLAAMVTQAWDLASIERSYEAFLTEFGGASSETATSEDAGSEDAGSEGAGSEGAGSEGASLEGEGHGNGTGDSLARLAGLVHAWRRFPFLDPGLPAELLPARWSGVTAAELFTRLHTRWSPAATAEWRRLNQAGD